MRQLVGVCALALGLVIGVARAEKSTPFPWDHEGYASLLAAAKDARDHGQRLLLGLSGGETWWVSLDLGSGRLSEILGDEKVRKAAEGFVRVRIRVPEAYLLLEPYSTTRPGLLVLDADGRHVDSIDLAIAGGLTADDVARRLIAAKKAPGVERLRVKTTDAQGEEREAVAAALRAMKGVRAVSEADGGLRVEADVAAVDPAAVVALLAKAGPHATLEEPVLVTLEPRPGNPAEHVKALLAVPGNWRSGPVGSVSVWMTRLLVHPDPLRDAGWTSDLVAERFTFASLPKGGSAVTVLRAPEKVPGALAVIPDVFRDAITVVGRAAMDLEKVRDAFRAAGADPLPAAK